MKLMFLLQCLFVTPCFRLNSLSNSLMVSTKFLSTINQTVSFQVVNYELEFKPIFSRNLNFLSSIHFATKAVKNFLLAKIDPRRELSNEVLKPHDPTDWDYWINAQIAADENKQAISEKVQTKKSPEVRSSDADLFPRSAEVLLSDGWFEIRGSELRELAKHQETSKIWSSLFHSLVAAINSLGSEWSSLEWFAIGPDDGITRPVRVVVTPSSPPAVSNKQKTSLADKSLDAALHTLGEHIDEVTWTVDHPSTHIAPDAEKFEVYVHTAHKTAHLRGTVASHDHKQ